MSWVNVQTTDRKYELYLWMEEQYGKGHERICIDGKRTASCKCTGCCMFEVHPGFLTAKLQERHKCMENDCISFMV